MASDSSRSEQAAIARIGAGFGGRFLVGFHRRNVVSVLLGASIGFGIGVAFHALWRAAVDRFTMHNNTDRLMLELENLKRELADVRQMLNFTGDRMLKANQLDPIPPFYLADDDDEEDYFHDFDDENGGFNEVLFTSSTPYTRQSTNESREDDLGPGTSGDRPPSGESSFHTVPSYSSSKQSVLRLGPPLSKSIAEELDQLAQLALGEISAVCLTPKVGASGDESRWGTQAYARCLVYRRKYRRTPEFLWRFARATFLASESLDTEEDYSASVNEAGDALSDYSTSNSSRTFDPSNPNDVAYDLSSRRQFIETGLGLARRALRLALNSRQDIKSNISNECLAEIYKWLAVLVGLACDFGGLQQRILYGKEFKTLIDQAIELCPTDALSHFLKGRWCYEVYNLTWIERQFASRLFATPPTATIEEAQAAFEEVEKLRPNYYAANGLYLAKCFISQSNYKEAGVWLNRAKTLTEQQRAPPPHLDTTSVSAEVESLISKYSAYF
ncbi:Regulator of microtubule dynamics protein 3 [Fasciola gigantica]|uniref:Regulator of microtubule dynamics protein 3 n=1 Tax=Fasciola gigantica TaxID=46835 RepID=A0A504YHK2_FASGI|nr:Regulator of microtubule dynamics protein 3 [Fasciola gigantica]